MQTSVNRIEESANCKIGVFGFSYPLISRPGGGGGEKKWGVMTREGGGRDTPLKMMTSFMNGPIYQQGRLWMWVSWGNMCKYTQDPILGMKCQMLCVARKANRAGKLWGLQLHFSVKRRRGLRETRSSRSRCLFANHSLEFLPDLPPSPTSTCLWWPASSPKGAGSSWRPWCTPSGLNLASNPWQSRAILNNPAAAPQAHPAFFTKPKRNKIKLNIYRWYSFLPPTSRDLQT